MCGNSFPDFGHCRHFEGQKFLDVTADQNSELHKAYESEKQGKTLLIPWSAAIAIHLNHLFEIEMQTILIWNAQFSYLVFSTSLLLVVNKFSLKFKEILNGKQQGFQPFPC